MTLALFGGINTNKVNLKANLLIVKEKILAVFSIVVDVPMCIYPVVSLGLSEGSDIKFLY